MMFLMLKLVCSTVLFVLCVKVAGKDRVFSLFFIAIGCDYDTIADAVGFERGIEKDGKYAMGRVLIHFD